MCRPRKGHCKGKCATRGVRGAYVEAIVRTGWRGVSLDDCKMLISCRLFGKGAQSLKGTRTRQEEVLIGYTEGIHVTEALHCSAASLQEWAVLGPRHTDDAMSRTPLSY